MPFKRLQVVPHEGRRDKETPRRIRITRILLLLVFPCLGGFFFPQAQADKKVEVGKVLDAWHKAAAEANEEAYFSHFTKDGVLMGTDATERWTRDEFRVWAKPYFAKGKAWTFRSVRRSITLAPEGTVAWFDEDLATENLGPCRGSGVLVLQGNTWKIAHYNLSVPIPNEVFPEVKKLIEKKK